MLSFTRNLAIAVTWSTDNCQAVRLRADGNVCKVEACWQGQVGKDGASLAELLLHAVKAVGGDDSIYIIAGGNGQGWGMADLNMPSLKRDELKNALTFELKKQTPLSAEKLHWGYRVLPKKAGVATQPVRLFYVRTEHWNSWLKAADGLHHIDAILPAPVALDPVLQDSTFVMPEPHDAPARYEYVPCESGRAVAPRNDNAPLTLAQAIPPETCQLGPLAQLDETARAQFAPAIVLGIYGLTDCVNTDSATMLPIPERFRARRHVAVKIASAVIAVYIIGLIAYAIAGNFSGHAAQLRQIDQAIKKAQAELDQLNEAMSLKVAEKTALIRQELQDNTPNRPDFPTVLMAVTQTIPSTHWISDSFEWRDGQVSFKIQGSSKEMELTSKLEDSKFLGDVTERLSTMNNGAYTQRFEAIARYDTEIEADVLRTRQETMKKREEERLKIQKEIEEKVKAAQAEEDAALEEEDGAETIPEGDEESEDAEAEVI
ncbi:MAG: hypothetical protein MJ106_01770 [Lentisphaeria bacterium]|nr:hypothetical protein [Lentisphaeria bacterium]